MFVLVIINFTFSEYFFYFKKIIITLPKSFLYIKKRNIYIYIYIIKFFAKI